MPGLEEQLIPQWELGSVDGDDMYFSTLMGIDFDDAGNLYGLDFRDQTITKIDADKGEIMGRFGAKGQGPGELAGSRSLAWFQGKVLVANEGNGRVEVFSEDGEPLDPVRLSEVATPSYVFAHGDHLMVGRRFVPDGHFVYRYGQDLQAAEPLKEAGRMAERLDFLRSHNLQCPTADGTWIVYMLLDKIEKIDDSGNTVISMSRELDWDFPVEEDGEVVPEILVTRRCATDPEGNLYVIYSNPEDWKRGNDVFKFAPDGRLLGKAFTLPVHRATALAFDGQGDLYYSDGVTLFKAQVQAG
ncbi:MAG: hypothetical protein AAF604_07590 [Acidobacteriota bacterium]